MQQIIDKRDIVRNEIDLKHNKWEHSTSEDSFYTEINNEKSSINERCSFHYPVLERWLQMAMKRFQVKKSKYNPLQGDNIAFVFHDKRTEGTTNANISSNLMEGAQKMFKSSNNFIVTLYDWDLDILTKDEIKLVFRNINASFAGNEFSDPLANTEHRANVTPVEAMLVRKNNNKTNENRNMKQTIRLTESELKHIIRESVKRVLNEQRVNTSVKYRTYKEVEDAVYAWLEEKYPEGWGNDGQPHQIEALRALGFVDDGYDQYGARAFTNGAVRVTVW